MRTSEKGIELIKAFEGCKLKAYLCPAGVWTIGFGHTKGVKLGQEITKEQATELLKADLIKFEKKVNEYSKYHWTQEEFDAMVSFAYNVGSLDMLTGKGTRTKAAIASKLLLYNKGGGRILAGLDRRRKAEQKLFLSK